MRCTVAVSHRQFNSIRCAGRQSSGQGLSIIRGTESIEFDAEADNDVRFAQGSGGQLILDDSAQFFGNIYQMTVGDRSISGTLRSNSANPSAMKVGGDSGFSTLDSAHQITNGTSLSSNLFLEGNYQSAAFTLNSDAHGGTTITLAALLAERKQCKVILRPWTPTVGARSSSAGFERAGARGSPRVKFIDVRNVENVIIRRIEYASKTLLGAFQQTPIRNQGRPFHRR